MILSIISFTEKGIQLSRKIEIALKTAQEVRIRLYTKCKMFPVINWAGEQIQERRVRVVYVEESITDWAGEQMQAKNALLFIGACGIAVRAIAPYLISKLQDVPVLVMDESGHYIIPILSGHMGGANGLAESIAEKTGAEPVITTATDIRRKFAVDLFAKKNGLAIINKEGIAKVSAKVLAGREVTLSVMPERRGQHREKNVVTKERSRIKESSLPAGVRLVPYPPAGFADIVVSSENKKFDASILLSPREYVIGLGCKKGKSVDEIDQFVSKKLANLGIATTQLFALASISQKAKEQGIVAWCSRQGIPFWTYTAEELEEMEGAFAESSFVKEQVGVGNVCERAAVRACGQNGKLIARKEAENGITIAVAQREWKVCFDEE